jgi:serine/threonine-protein kinase RsbW
MLKVSFPGRYESLSKIAEIVHQATQELGLDSCAAYGVETAVDEACSNIIEHAYGGENKGEIYFSYDIKGNELSIILKDRGKRFIPEQAPKPNLHAPLKERQEHGLGLHFIYQWMDEVHFDFINGLNVLTMIKRKGR